MDPKTSKFGNISWHQFESRFGHSEEAKWEQIEVAEGGQKGRNSKMRADENSGKTIGKKHVQPNAKTQLP